MPTALQTYLGSKELKKLLVNRSFELELPFKLICIDIEVDYKHFMESYINSSDNNHFVITEEKFEMLLKALGIEIRHQFVINKKFDYLAKQEYLREVFNNKK